MSDFSWSAYFFNIAVWIDEGVATVFLGSDPHCTVSGWLGSHSAKYAWAYYGAQVVDWVFPAVNGVPHCTWFAQDEARNSGSPSWLGCMRPVRKSAANRE